MAAPAAILLVSVRRELPIESGGNPRRNSGAVTMKATLLRAGMIIKHEGDLFVVYSVDHRTPGNKRAAMQTKMRNLRTGSMIDYRFRAEESLDKVVVDEIEHKYLYSDAEGHP